MIANPFPGIFLHTLGGLAAGSFYLPFKKVRKRSWESYQLVGGLGNYLDSGKDAQHSAKLSQTCPQGIGEAR